MASTTENESPNERRSNVRFAQPEEATAGGDPLEEAEERLEYSYPDLEQICWSSIGADDADDEPLKGKMGAAAACALRAAEAAAAGAAIVDKNNLRSARAGERKIPKNKNLTQSFA